MSGNVLEIKKCDRDKPYIFISHCKRDSDIVNRDVIEFQRRGYNVWFDDVNLDKTKKSWKQDAIDAIIDYDCNLLVFYLSKDSIISNPCYDELLATVSHDAKIEHNGHPVKIIIIETQYIDDITEFSLLVQEELKSTNVEKNVKREKIRVTQGIIREFFDSNNERVRIRPKDFSGRKVNYYDEIIECFPDNAITEQVRITDINKFNSEEAEVVDSNVCEQCSTLIQAGIKFCPECGKKVGEDIQKSEKVSMDESKDTYVSPFGNNNGFDFSDTSDEDFDVNLFEGSSDEEELDFNQFDDESMNSIDSPLVNESNCRNVKQINSIYGNTVDNLVESYLGNVAGNSEIFYVLRHHSELYEITLDNEDITMSDVRKICEIDEYGEQLNFYDNKIYIGCSGKIICINLIEQTSEIVVEYEDQDKYNIRNMIVIKGDIYFTTGHTSSSVCGMYKFDINENKTTLIVESDCSESEHGFSGLQILDFSENMIFVLDIDDDVKILHSFDSGLISFVDSSIERMDLVNKKQYKGVESRRIEEYNNKGKKIKNWEYLDFDDVTGEPYRDRFTYNKLYSWTSVGEHGTYALYEVDASGQPIYTGVSSRGGIENLSIIGKYFMWSYIDYCDEIFDPVSKSTYKLVFEDLKITNYW